MQKMDQITSLAPAGVRVLEVPVQEEELGVIGKETTIHGDVEGKGHLAVYGCVNGNIDIKGNLLMLGEVKGSIRCKNLILDECSLFTAINASGNVSVRANAVITGDIRCISISVLGSVYGDIYADKDAGLAGSAVVEGNISCEKLAVEPGADFDGKVKIHKADD